MLNSEMLMIWSPNLPVLSITIWVIILVLLLYLARTPAHLVIMTLGRGIYNSMRLASRGLSRTEARIIERNHAVLLAAGREATERVIEREFRRIQATINRDLEAYPALQRHLTDQVTLIDEDYRNSSQQIPKAPTGWVKAIEAVANLQAESAPNVADVLRDIHKSLIVAQNKALQLYRADADKRHSLLAKMLPYWRSTTAVLTDINKTITSLIERSGNIDRHMDTYEQIMKGNDRALNTLSSSSLTQFFIAGFVLAIAIGGAIVNFNLIAYPMQEMVGGSSYIGSFRTSDIAGMVIILIELAMGIFLLESMRITGLFPVINALDDKMRRRMFWISLTILFLLACIESALAFMRDIMAADAQAFRQSLSGTEVVENESAVRGIPTAGQMVMGFILPFALAFVAIPLESFIHAARTVIGVMVVASMRLLRGLLRQIGSLFLSFSKILVTIYDLLIFGPLWVEGMVRKDKPEKSRTHAKEKYNVSR